MNVTGSQIRRAGWLAVLAICVTLFAVLSFNVSAVKSEVLLAEREIIVLERGNRMLEAEFQTRASQRQLAEWNAVELGYRPPRADQYLEGERQLASLGVPTDPDAPSPIRVARADLDTADAPASRMVSPVSGQPITFASVEAGGDAGAVFTEAFGDFLIDASPIRTANARTPVMSEGPVRESLAREGGRGQ